MLKQVHAYFIGKVQGIGFRFTAVDIAQELGVVGWVKNLRDGRVELCAEAQEDVLISFLNRLNQHFGRYISETEAEWGPATGEFSDFGIEFLSVCNLICPVARRQPVFW